MHLAVVGHLVKEVFNTITIHIKNKEDTLKLFDNELAFSDDKKILEKIDKRIDRVLRYTFLTFASYKQKNNDKLLCNKDIAKAKTVLGDVYTDNEDPHLFRYCIELIAGIYLERILSVKNSDSINDFYLHAETSPIGFLRVLTAITFYLALKIELDDCSNNKILAEHAGVSIQVFNKFEIFLVTELWKHNSATTIREEHIIHFITRHKDYCVPKNKLSINESLITGISSMYIQDPHESPPAKRKLKP